MRPSLRQVLFRSATGLDLNFAGGAFSLNNTRSASPAAIPGWSFSRTDTNGTATALDLAGNVIEFATGVPRITNRGILVEEARTNLCIADWQAPGVGVSITSTTITNPVGGTTAIRVTGLLAAAGDRAGSSVALVSVGVQYAGAVFIKGTAGEKISVYTKRLNGTSATSATVQVTFTGLWQRVENLVMTTATGNTGIIVWINNNGTTDTANTVDLWNAQVEAGAFSTSPIITTGAAGTRGADVALVDSLTSITYPLTMVGEWSREGGTDATTSYRVASLSRVADDSYSEIYQRHTSNVVRAFQRTLAAGQADVTLGTGSIGDVQRAAARFATNDVTGSFNGAAVVSDTVVTMPASPPLSFAVGSTNGTSRWLNGYIRRVQVLPYAVTDAQLQALTAP